MCYTGNPGYASIYGFKDRERGPRGCNGILLDKSSLDCPICDQGGECQLQDCRSAMVDQIQVSKKRKGSFHKPLGELISAEENVQMYPLY